jgi:50S ribosomal subunit-associated GTPase HflX
MSQSITADERRARKVREICDRFCVLTIGRANAGKTTVLQKVCNTTEQAEIYNSEGEKARNV